MSTSNSQPWENSQIGIVALLLAIFFIWVFAGGRPFLSNNFRDIKTTLQDAGRDFKTTGRDAAASIRQSLQ